MRTLWVTCASLHPTYYTVSSAAFAFFVAFSFLFFFPPSVAFAFSLYFYPLVGSFVFVHPIFSCPADHVQYSTVQTVQYRIDNRVVEARSVKRTHTHTHIQSLIPPREDQCEWHRMTRMTGPDCVVMCNLINTHTHTSLITPWENQCEWHRMTGMTGPDCAVMCNLINTHTRTTRVA